MTLHQFFCILHFCHTCSLCRVELVVQFPARGSTQVLLCLFPGMLWLWLFLYSVVPHPESSLHINSFVVSRAFMAGAVSQAGDADSSRAPGLTSGLQGSVNVHHGALLLVPHWQCISSIVLYIQMITLFPSLIHPSGVFCNFSVAHVLNYFVWLAINEKGSVPKIRIQVILVIKSNLYIQVKVSFCINADVKIT